MNNIRIKIDHRDQHVKVTNKDGKFMFGYSHREIPNSSLTGYYVTSIWRDEWALEEEISLHFIKKICTEKNLALLNLKHKSRFIRELCKVLLQNKNVSSYEIINSKAKHGRRRKKI